MPTHCECESNVCWHRDQCHHVDLVATTIHGTKLCEMCAALMPKQYLREPERHTYHVVVYWVNLAYGGPEEGGWWYSEGELVRACKQFRSEEQAYAYCRALNDKLEGLNERLGNRPIDSVISDGQLEASVFADVFPKSFPETKPHYE